MSVKAFKDPIWFLTGSTGVLGSKIGEELKAHNIAFFCVDFRDDIQKKNLLNDLTVRIPSEINSGHDLVVIHTATHYGRNNDSLKDILYANINLPAQFLVNCLAIPRLSRVVFVNIDTLADEKTSVYADSKHKFRKLIYELEDPRLVVYNFATDFLYHESDRHDKFIPRIVRHMTSTLTIPDLANPSVTRRPLNTDFFASYIVSEILNSAHSSDTVRRAVVGKAKLKVRDMVEMIKICLCRRGIEIRGELYSKNCEISKEKINYLRNYDENESLQIIDICDIHRFESYVEKIVKNFLGR